MKETLLKQINILQISCIFHTFISIKKKKLNKWKCVKYYDCGQIWLSKHNHFHWWQIIFFIFSALNYNILYFIISDKNRKHFIKLQLWITHTLLSQSLWNILLNELLSAYPARFIHLYCSQIANERCRTEFNIMKEWIRQIVEWNEQKYKSKKKPPSIFCHSNYS